MVQLPQDWLEFASPLLAQPLWLVGLALAAVSCVLFIYRRRKTAVHSMIPSETLRFVALHNEASWTPASIEGRPAMHASGVWRVTNITSSPIQIVKAYLDKPRVDGLMVVSQRSNGKTWGVEEIAPNATVDVSVDFWIDPPIKKPGQSFKAAAIFVDQFNNSHRVQSQAFANAKPDASSTPVEAEWVPDTAAARAAVDHTTPIELQVSAVLKAEILRYEQCGRRIGGLGSVQTRYGESVLCGVGSVWREASANQGPLIVEPGAEARIESDNADSLVKLYASLSDSEQFRFVAALRRRLSRYGECAPVAYLSLLVLFRTGNLKEALSTARAYLQGDESAGFSEFLLLLDGLLRFEHRNFSDMMLDEVQRFIDSLDDYAFGIPDRLQEIRRKRRTTTPTTVLESLREEVNRRKSSVV